MKIRTKKKPEITGSSSEFNTHSLNEIIVCFEDGGMDSDYMTNYEVWLECSNQWKDMSLAFKDKDLIPDNYNRIFKEPVTEEELKQGWF